MVTSLVQICLPSLVKNELIAKEDPNQGQNTLTRQFTSCTSLKFLPAPHQLSEIPKVTLGLYN